MGRNIVCAEFCSSPSTSHRQITLAASLATSHPDASTPPLPLPLHSQPPHTEASTSKNISSLVSSSSTDVTHNDKPKLKKKSSKSRWDKDLRPKIDLKEQNADEYNGATGSASECEDDEKETWEESAEAEGGDWIVIDMCDKNGEPGFYGDLLMLAWLARLTGLANISSCCYV